MATTGAMTPENIRLSGRRQKNASTATAVIACTTTIDSVPIPTMLEAITS